MKNLSLEQMEVVEGGKFIGIEKSCTVCLWGTIYCTKTFYFLGAVLGAPWETEESC